VIVINPWAQTNIAHHLQINKTILHQNGEIISHPGISDVTRKAYLLITDRECSSDFSHTSFSVKGYR
jgi:hypothetical protein